MMDTFNGGYTKALLDVQHFFESYSEALSHNKLYNRNGIEAILKCLIDNREELRETGNLSGIIVRNGKKSTVIEKADAK